MVNALWLLRCLQRLPAERRAVLASAATLALAALAGTWLLLGGVLDAMLELSARGRAGAHTGPFFAKLLIRNLHPFAAEIVDTDTLDDLILTILTNTGEGVDNTLTDTVAAVSGHRHAYPVVPRRTQCPRPHMVNGGGSGGSGGRRTPGLDDSGATLLHIHLHHFTLNGGISGVAVLAESHISVHTWPERGYAAFDVFMCGEARPERALDVFRKAFSPGRVIVREHRRGLVEE